MAAGVAPTRVAARTRGASGMAGSSTSTTSVARSAGNAAINAVATRASSSAARASLAAARAIWAIARTASAATSRAPRPAARATGSGLLLDEDAGGDALGQLFHLGRAAGRQLGDVLLDLLLGVRRHLVEADADVAAGARAEIGDLAGQVQPLAVGE